MMVIKNVSRPAAASGIRLAILVAATALVAALTLTTVSLAIPYWVTYHVDTTRVFRNDSSNLDYYNRNRGVFLTCMNDTSAALALRMFVNQIKYSTCMDVDLGNLDNATHLGFIGWNGAWGIITMRRLHLALHLASGFCLCVSLAACLSSCVVLRAACLQFISCGVSLLAAGFQFGALIAFHSFLMKELMPAGVGNTAASPFPLSGTVNLYNAMPRDLQMATQVHLGESYYIALAAFCTSLISGFINMVCGASISCRNTPKAVDSNETAAAVDKYIPGYGVAPAGSSLKANGNDMGRFDNMSNLSGRLPRIPMNQGYGGGGAVY